MLQKKKMNIFFPANKFSFSIRFECYQLPIEWCTKFYVLDAPEWYKFLPIECRNLLGSLYDLTHK